MNVSQGVAVDSHYFYAISNTQIVKCDKASGEKISTWKADMKNPKHAHFKHLNSATATGGKLYVAHSRFPTDPNDCSVEIWNIEGQTLMHESSIRLARKYGSLTWIDQDTVGDWWMCFAVYGKEKNVDTRLVKYTFNGIKFAEIKSWAFPKEVVSKWGRWSCSGGSWGREGYLYTTGHDKAEVYVLEIGAANELRYVRTLTGLGFYGQGIAWDRYAEKSSLWGIVKNKDVSVTRF